MISVISRIRWWLRGWGVPIRLTEAEAQEMLALFKRVTEKLPMTMYERSGIGSVPMPERWSGLDAPKREMLR